MRLINPSYSPVQLLRVLALWTSAATGIFAPGIKDCQAPLADGERSSSTALKRRATSRRD